MARLRNPDGTVNLFGNAAAAAAALNSFQPDFPGQSGNRNSLRGDGFAGLDLGLSKLWHMPWKESHSLQFPMGSFQRPEPYPVRCRELESFDYEFQ